MAGRGAGTFYQRENQQPPKSLIPWDGSGLLADDADPDEWRGDGQEVSPKPAVTTSTHLQALLAHFHFVFEKQGSFILLCMYGGGVFSDVTLLIYTPHPQSSERSKPPHTPIPPCLTQLSSLCQALTS